MREGFKLAFEEIGNKIAGRGVQIIVGDTELKPDVGLTKTRKLVESDKVNILAGVLSSGTGYAIRDYVHENKIPLVLTVAGGVALTQQLRSPYIFRASFTNSQYIEPFGEWLSKGKGYRKVSILAGDYIAGYEEAGAFAQGFLTGGGEVLQEFYPALGTTDYAPYITAISSEADLVWAFFSGIDAIRFLTQYQEYGLKGKIDLAGNVALINEYVYPKVGDAALGVMGSAPRGDPQSPEFLRFQKAVRAKGVESTFFAENAYEGALFIIKALESVNGDIENTEAFLEALRGTKLTNTPGGTLSFDEFQDVIRDVHVLEVQKVDGKLQLVSVHVFPQTTEFWYMTPKEYMEKTPTYGKLKGKWAGRTKPM
jgi:branched-chain amino acid transport system substrate-binding protein